MNGGVGVVSGRGSVGLWVCPECIWSIKLSNNKLLKTRNKLLLRARDTAQQSSAWVPFPRALSSVPSTSYTITTLPVPYPAPALLLFESCKTLNSFHLFSSSSTMKTKQGTNEGPPLAFCNTSKGQLLGSPSQKHSCTNSGVASQVEIAFFLLLRDFYCAAS